MHTPITKATSAFKRQIVFRISADDWPLLETAAREHGSIQAAILAGLRSLAAAAEASRRSTKQSVSDPEPGRPTSAEATSGDGVEDPDEEIRARHAAVLLGVKASTVSGYIRAGRMAGRYDDTPGSSGWVTTRGAVNAYKKRIGRR